MCKKRCEIVSTAKLAFWQLHVAKRQYESIELGFVFLRRWGGGACCVGGG